MAWMTTDSGSIANGETYTYNTIGDATHKIWMLTAQGSMTYKRGCADTFAGLGAGITANTPKEEVTAPQIQITNGSGGVATVKFVEWVRDPA